MDKYIQQLIEDLAEIEANPIPEPDFGTSYEDFERVMLQLELAPRVPSEQLLNISYEQLPPAERLNKMQMQKLLIAIFNALLAKRISVSIPGKGVPVGLIYTEIRDMFKEGFPTMPGWVIDFCSGWCPDCAFTDYCDSCKESWSKEELEKERKRNSSKEP
ncbi:MAG: hypothetical protein BWY70_01190 [Bacteroidetes bacterium ADurb.Bin408]|nr:MAG: hypothetical protein BWY70_01190 [Bacteroidetes bacterium ADurb.Bin408]